MALVIEQKPKYSPAAAGQELMFVIAEDTNIITTKTNVKFLATIYVAKQQTQPTIAGVFKATPNNAGVGMFDVSTIIENYVSPDYSGVNENLGFQNNSPVASTYGSLPFDETSGYHPVHLIDRYCLSSNSIKFLSIIFNIEYLGADGDDALVETDPTMNAFSTTYLIYNGVLYDTDVLNMTSGSPDFGYALDYNTDRRSYILQTDGAGRGEGDYITDAPRTQDARIDDYGTLAFFNDLRYTSGDDSFYIGTTTSTPYTIKEIQIKLYNSAGGQLGSTMTVTNNQLSGGYSNTGQDIPNTDFATSRLLYFGAFPANLTGGYAADNTAYADWNTHKANVSYYTIQAINQDDGAAGELYRINIIEGDCRYEHFRICWLNKHGVWDYFTFTKKSIRNLTTNRTNYTQLGGTWNSKAYQRRGDRGGQKNFKVNTKEKITVNTDYLTEDYNEMMEQLINSPEVYLVNPFDSTVGFFASGGGNINRHVQAVVLTTSSFTRKTVGNDKLIQYTIEFERVNNRRTQRM